VNSARAGCVFRSDPAVIGPQEPGGTGDGGQKPAAGTNQVTAMIVAAVLLVLVAVLLLSLRGKK